MTERRPSGPWWETRWAALVVAIALLLWNPPVPDLSECGYLLGAYRAGHPGFLAGDFTFGTGHPKTLLFDAFLGPLTQVVRLETLATVGRVAFLAILALGLIRIGTKAGLSAGAAALAVLAWMAFGEAVVGGEATSLNLVPKTIAWAAGIWALDATLARRPRLAGALLGIAIGFQVSVGASLSLAIAAAMVALRYDARSWSWAVGLSFAIAIPTILPTVGSLGQPGTDLVAEWRYQALERLPVHLDLHYFSKRSLGALAAMAAFVLVAARRSQETVRALGWIVLAMVAVFGFGIAATLAGRYDLLAVFPFRAPPVLIQFAFFVVAILGFQQGRESSPRLVFPLASIAILLMMPNPINRTLNGRFKGAIEPADHLAALAWVRDSTPAAATLVVSPVRRCTQFVSHRSQIVYGDLARLDRIREWRERFEAHFGPGTRGLNKGQLDQAFNRLDEPSIRTLVRRYGGDYLLTKAVYRLPVVHESGAYRVYDLSGLERPLPR